MIFHYLQLLGGFVSVGVGGRKVRVRLSDFSVLYKKFSDCVSDGSTHRVEKRGAKVMKQVLWADGEIDKFVRCVCLWGGDLWGGMCCVYGNLVKLNGGPIVAKKIIARAVRGAVGYLQLSQMESAIGELRSVNGLGKKSGTLSYASKILRMLAPDRAVTFDSHLEYVFEGRLDNVGYQKWCADCAKLACVLEQKKIKNTARANQIKWKAADIEAVIFVEARKKKKSDLTSAKR